MHHHFCPYKSVILPYQLLFLSTEKARCPKIETSVDERVDAEADGLDALLDNLVGRRFI